MKERQLQWVQENRRRQCAASALGELARDLVNSPKLSGSPWHRRLMAILETHGGPELLEHAKIVDVRNGELVLQVTEPAVLYQLRLAFEQRLLDALAAELPEAGIHAVRFVVGTRV
jgi:hypothetical protein